MANKNSFNASEWGLLKDAPYYVQAAINAAEGRMGLMEVKREANALKSYLNSNEELELKTDNDINNNNNDYNMLKSGFVKEFDQSSNERRQVRFIHKSFLEYLSAKALSGKKKEKK